MMESILLLVVCLLRMHTFTVFVTTSFLLLLLIVCFLEFLEMCYPKP